MTNTTRTAEQVRILTTADADAMVTAARRSAEELGVRITVAVIDGSREPIALRRDHRASLISGEIALSKARTAMSFNRRTEELSAAAQPGAPFYGIGSAVQMPITTFAGGVPLTAQGHAIGAIGVSGGTPAQDSAIADAAALAFDG